MEAFLTRSEGAVLWVAHDTPLHTTNTEHGTAAAEQEKHERDEYDVIVIGGGRRGRERRRPCGAGRPDAVIVEHELVGGECSYWACMPSKTLLRRRTRCGPPGGARRRARP